MYTVFIVGMAGSGKSLLTATFLEWLKLKGIDAIAVNLDPGASSLPYNPDVDVRSYVDLRGLMEDYGLGPNGALVMACDLIGDHLEEVRDEIEDAKPDMAIADTAGQIELFAFRESGPYITEAIAEGPKAVVYLFDGPFCRSPVNFVSNMFIAAAVYSRLGQPQVYAITKADLLSEDELNRIMEWSTEPEPLEEALKLSANPSISLVSRELANAIYATGLMYEPISISAKLHDGFLELDAALTRILSGGEEPSA